MTSEEQADARQRIEMCVLIAKDIERDNHGLHNISRAKQIQKQLAVVAKLLRNGTNEPRGDQPED